MWLIISGNEGDSTDQNLVQPATLGDMKKAIADASPLQTGVIHDATERFVLGQMEKIATDFWVLYDEKELAALKTQGDIDKWYRAVGAKIKVMENMAAMMKTAAAREKAGESINKMKSLLEFIKNFRDKTATQHVAEMGSGASNGNTYESAAAMAHHHDNDEDERVF